MSEVPYSRTFPLPDFDTVRTYRGTSFTTEIEKRERERRVLRPFSFLDVVSES